MMGSEVKSEKSPVKVPVKNRLGEVPVENRLGRVPAQNRLGPQWNQEEGQEDQEDRNHSRSCSARGRPSGRGFMQPRYRDERK